MVDPDDDLVDQNDAIDDQRGHIIDQSSDMADQSDGVEYQSGNVAAKSDTLVDHSDQSRAVIWLIKVMV